MAISWFDTCVEVGGTVEESSQKVTQVSR